MNPQARVHANTRVPDDSPLAEVYQILRAAGRRAAAEQQASARQAPSEKEGRSDA